MLKDIRVEGLQRTDPGTVFALAAVSHRRHLHRRQGRRRAARAVRHGPVQGRAHRDRRRGGGRHRRGARRSSPTVDFVGLKEFDKDTLIKSLQDSGIGEGLPFDKALVDRAEQEIKRQYLTRSLYGAEVVTTVTPIERNRVNVTFTMTEGDAARITRDPHRRQQGLLRSARCWACSSSTTSGWLTWYTKTDRYSRAKLNADLETLRSYYLNRGYLEFNVESTQVTISPDKQDISITITVSEGQPYTVTGGAGWRATTWARKTSSSAWCASSPGEPYRAEDVTDTTKALHRPLRHLRLRVRARRGAARDRPRQRPGGRGHSRADPQRRVYVRRIDVAGNTRTRDEVIRREFRQFESSWYDGSKIKLSRDRVDRLGYFKDVSVDTNEVPGSPDQVDLTVNVTEKPTGNLSVGAELLERREAGADRRRSSRRTCSARATTWAWRSTPASTTARWCSARSTRTSRSTASRAPSTCTTAPRRPLNSLGDALPDSPPRAARCASACRSPSSTRCSSASAPSAPTSRPTPSLPNSLLPLPRAVRRRAAARSR